MAHRPYLRPSSVSLVCYLLIIGAAFGLFIALNVTREPGVDLNRTLLFISLAVSLVSGLCGAFMLRGSNWARIAFICAAVPLAVLFWLHNMANGFAIFRLSLLLTYCVVLFRPAANCYFAGREFRRVRDNKDDEPMPKGRRRSYDY